MDQAAIAVARWLISAGSVAKPDAFGTLFMLI